MSSRRVLVADRPEEGAVVVDPVPGRLEVVVDQRVGCRGAAAPGLFAVAADPQVWDAAPRVPEVPHLSLHSSSRRSAWKSRVERIARSRLSLI